MKRVFYKLNILKFLAFLHIFLRHSLSFLEPNINFNDPIPRFIWANFYSTSIFFVLNGFLLTYIYIDKIAGMNIYSFFKTRIKKFYPLYIIVIVLSLPLVYDLSNSILTFGAKTIINILILQAWIPKLSTFSFTSYYWTLSCFITYYIIFIPLVKMLKKLNNKQLLLLLFFGNILEISISSILYDSNLFPYINNFLHHNPIVRFPEFLGGCIAAILFKRNQENDIILSIQKNQFTIIIVNLIAIYAAKSFQYMLVHNGLFLILQILLVISLTSPHNFRYDRIVKFFSKLGQSSIEFYLLNGFFLYFTFRFANVVKSFLNIAEALNFGKFYYHPDIFSLEPNLFLISIICIISVYFSIIINKSRNLSK